MKTRVRTFFYKLYIRLLNRIFNLGFTLSIWAINRLDAAGEKTPEFPASEWSPNDEARYPFRDYDRY